MTLADLIPIINNNLRGTDDDAPTVGTDDYIYWVGVVNQLKNNLYADTGQTWGDTYEDRVIGTISAGEGLSFDLDSDFLAPSNKVYVLMPDDSRVYYDICKPKEADTRNRQVFVAGQFTQTLTFTDTILSDDRIVGGVLHMPAHWIPKDMSDPTSKVPVRDPYWLAMASAAEIAFNDLTYEDKFADLQGKANNLYKFMVRRNRRGTYGSGRITPTRVKRIRGF